MEGADVNPLQRGPKPVLDHPAVSGSFRLSMWVPTEFVGKVIGSKGAVVQHIQREAQSRVVVLPILEEKLWTPLSISGDPSRVRQTYNLILKIVEDDDDVVAEFRNPFSHLKSAVGGQHGSFIKKLSADHSVRVFVPHARGGEGFKDALMSLEGTFDSVWRALEEIVTFFESDEARRDLERASLHGSSPAEGPAGSWRKPRAESDAAPGPPRSDGKRSESVVNVDEVVPIEVQDERFDSSFAYNVDIPASIVGKLCSSKTSARVNVIAAIGKATYTFIACPKQKSAAKSKKAAEDLGVAADKATGDLVTVTVVGKTSHNVALAARFLLRIVAGERIKDVLRSVETCVPHPTAPAVAKALGDDGIPMEEKQSKAKADSTIASAKSNLKAGGKKKPDKKVAKSVSTDQMSSPVARQEHEMDEDDINAHLFAAPKTSSSAPTSGKGSSRRGGKRRANGRGGNIEAAK